MAPWIWPLLAACTPDAPLAEAPEPGELRVGVAEVRMPVPLGIGTVGYGGFGITADPTPFAEIYPGTKRIHDHPRFEAIAISRGPGFEVVLLRSDTVGVFQQLRRAVVLELQQRLGRDLDDALIIGATHTHSGPGRVIDGEGPFELIADRFFPEFYAGMVDAMADAVEQALADLRPGRLGTGFGYTDDGHDDRRCEDGQTHENGTMPILAVEQEGELVGLALAYAVHGTILGIEELTLSADVSGGIEHAIEDRFDHPVVVAQFNAWGADMSPDDPVGDGVLTLEPGAVQPNGYDRFEAVGSVVADAVEATLPDLAWTDTPDILSRTYRVDLDREALGYPDGAFPFPYGGVYCSSPTASDCDPATTIDDLDQGCLPFSADYPAPDRTEITAGHLGPVDFVTFPGEPGTVLAEQILDRLHANGAGDVVFFGYAQDYSGYSILEDDWWQGGYEASGSLWGPKQGQYLADRVVDAWGWAHGDAAPGSEPPPIEPFDVGTFDPYRAPTAVEPGAVVTEVAAEVTGADEVVWVVNGDDPWFGAPIVTLETADGAPVLRPNGLPITSDGPAFWLELATDPTYRDAPDAPSRAFQWAFHLPVHHAVPGAGPTLAGDYRLSAALPLASGEIRTVTSAVFTVR
ncbi:MAG: neutral/alkaline non-lysosomal ceramidase N-terminal domain-containing protein [Myxococcota bacterium]